MNLSKGLTATFMVLALAGCGGEIDNVYDMAGAGHTAGVKRLLEKGIPVDEPNWAGITPVMTSLLQRDFETAKVLFCNGASPYKVNGFGLSVFHYAKTSKEGKDLFQRVESDRDKFIKEECDGLIVTPAPRALPMG